MEKLRERETVFRQSKYTGYQRLDDKLIVIGYMSGQVSILHGPAAMLWGQLALPTTLSAIANFLTATAGFPVDLQLVKSALMQQVEQGLLIAAEDLDQLEHLYQAPIASRGINTDSLQGAFLLEMCDQLQPMQIIKADLELNNSCNLRCSHCYISDYRDEKLLTLIEIESIFKQLSQVGVLFLNLTGGEITLCRDFTDIVDLARKYHFVLTILTNATTLRDRHIAALKQCAPANIFVSLYGVTAAVHETVTRREGTFISTVDSVHRLREAGIPVVLRYLVMHHNGHEVEALPEFADRMDCLYTTSYNLFVTTGSVERVHRSRISDEELAYLFQRDLVAPPRPANCTAGVRRIRVAANGDVFPCELLRAKLGNLGDSALEEILTSVRNEAMLCAIHTTPSTCLNCSKYSNCPRCPGLAFHENGSLSACSTEARRIARLYDIAKRPTRNSDSRRVSSNTS